MTTAANTCWVEFPHLGDLNGITAGHQFTKDLTMPCHQTNRNVTTDIWFMSVVLATDLINCNMTHIDTVRSNRKEIPLEMKDMRNRKQGSSAFLFTNNINLVSYCRDTSRTKKKVVYLMSTMHNCPTIMEDGKPEIMHFYNKIKGGVSTFDQMCPYYTVSHKMNNWPMCVFYGMINGSVKFNSWITHSENQLRAGGSTMPRCKYMQQSAVALIKPWAEKRFVNTPKMSHNLKEVKSTVCDIPLLTTAAPPGHIVMKDSRAPMICCSHGLRNKDRKTRHKCASCGSQICLCHIYPYCSDCQQ